MATARNIISSIGVIDSPGDGLKILQPYNSTTDNRYILTGTQHIQSLSGGLNITGTFSVLAPGSGSSFSSLTFVGSGSILNCVSGALGINVSPSASYPLDVEGALGNTVAKFGDTGPIYLMAGQGGSEILGFNTYYSGTFRYGKASTGTQYGGYINFQPNSNGQMIFGITNSPGSADAVQTNTSILVLSGAGPAALITSLDKVASANATLALQNSGNPASFLYALLQTGGGSFNPLTVANDMAFIFSSGTVSTGTFVIAPWSANGWGMRINGTNGTTGINCNPGFPLDIATGNGGLAGGNTTLVRVGTAASAPLFLAAGDPAISFNAFWSGSSGGYRYGGTGTWYGATIDFNETTAALVFDISNTPGTQNTVATLNTVMVLSGSGSNGGSVGLGASPGVGQQLDLTTDKARKLTTTTWSTGCDERIKEDIQIADYNLCLSGVMNLDLKYFKWKDLDWITTSDRHQLGWVAQDITSSFPKSVDINTEKGFDDFHSLNADQIYKMTYGAVKQLIIENQTLKQRLFNLETLLSTSF